MADWLHEARPNKRMAPAPATIRFRDIDSDYGLGIKNNSLLVDNDLAIRTQVRNLLSTPTGTEDNEPLYGSRLPYRIMETISPVNAFLIEHDTLLALNRWMRDRMRVVAGYSVLPLDSEDGYHIELPYVKISDNRFSTYVFDVLR